MISKAFHGGWYGLIAGTAFLLGIAHFGPKLYYQYASATNWIEYHSVKPILPFNFDTKEYEAKIGGKLWFKSHRTVKRLIEIEWIDTLLCKTEYGNFSAFSDADIKRPLLEDDLGEKETAWRYTGELPTEEALCYRIGTVKPINRYNVGEPLHVTDKHLIRFLP